MDNSNPAFPGRLTGANGVEFPGMTLRQWYAGMIMQGICAKLGHGSNIQKRIIKVYECADAMLEHEAKNGNKNGQ